MGKGPIITPKVRSQITSTYRQHPKWKAPAVRNEVESILRKKDPSLPQGWPSLSTVQKILVDVRKNMNRPSPEDEPWSMGALNRCAVDSSALPVLLELRDYLSKQGQSLTIREAKWAARITPLIHTKVIPYLEALSQWSYVYAYSERVHELAEVELDTQELDTIIKDYAEAWAAYPSLWDTLERQDGFAFAAEVLPYLIGLRHSADQRDLTDDEQAMLTYAERGESEWARVYLRLHSLMPDHREFARAAQMVDKIIRAEESVTLESAAKVLGKRDADWLIRCMEKGAHNERQHKTERQRQLANPGLHGQGARR